jgi:hypothetical protein
MATKAKAAPANSITGYCMKTKEKNVVLQDCTIDKNGNRYIAKGHDDDDNKITSIVSETKALAAIEAGTATKGAGWAAAKKAKA